VGRHGDPGHIAGRGRRAAFSEQARDTATVVKLVRNTLMAPVIVLIGLLQARTEQRGPHRPGTRWTVSKSSLVRPRLPGHDVPPHAGHRGGVLPQDLAHPGH